MHSGPKKSIIPDLFDNILLDSYQLFKHFTLTDLTISCPESLLKTTPPPQGYPWVSGGRYVTPEPKFSGLVPNHQGLEEIWLFFSGFLVLVLLKVDGRAPNP